MSMTPLEASTVIKSVGQDAIMRINALAREWLQTRGGRAGSGLGSLLEALWGFCTNAELARLSPTPPIDLAWFPDHAYNDFACVDATSVWDPTTGQGELLRVEAKSMYRGADESKAHFDALQRDLHDTDLLLVLIWAWVPIDSDGARSRVAPQIVDWFLDTAKPIAILRDKLHLARGGTFVTEDSCPDDCACPCPHAGEPLNADGRRERRTGPERTRAGKISHAANFGGLVRMLQTKSYAARATFRQLRRDNETAGKYISFIHSNFPGEEQNQYLLADWKKVASQLGIPHRGLKQSQICERVCSHPDYQKVLWALS